MVRWILLAVLVVVLTATATVVVQSVSLEPSISSGLEFPSASGNRGPLPKAVVDGDLTYKFGSKALHTKFERDWTIRNEGEGDLILTLEAPPCSCTVAGFMDAKRQVKGSKTVPPKGETVVHLTWETLANGHYHKPATLITNDPERPKITFAAEGEVSPAVMIYPPPENQAINVSEISSDQEEYKVTFAVYSQDKPDLKITEMTTSLPDYITVDQKDLPEAVCKEIKTEAGRQVTVTFKRGMTLGTFLQELVIKTDHPKEPELRLTLTGKIVGPISMVPAKLRLSGIPSQTGGQVELIMLVQNHRETKFEVRQKPEKFKVEIAPGDKASKPGKYRLIVTVPPGMPTGTVNEEIILETDHPFAKEVKVPIYGFIRDAG
ncbi:DUF1573 domain-containing protein [Singulisphaera acidiphila]|uniref:DUF1573 domain-containing protein n=1 Tax=Singulisphaera acidiphila (strain ATCC BAA-1392 / DSM 18658 / VKM B-2454 / MOB10) TaxID=886293 RepID=L0D973_SINAD|nr:DUF1573 domain-containing protein [Singulisphaera acidiphila]AGA25211.1 hypothetical protein Sinac_0802 [Singulisphaera acidiphila DSM 18658]